MSDISRVGTDWSADELDAIVADYFAMLGAEMLGQPYVKAHHARALGETVGRAHKAIEFKHMNISFVLSELALPIIRGYRPMRNIQQAIFPAVDRYLAAHPETLADDTFGLLPMRGTNSRGHLTEDVAGGLPSFLGVAESGASYSDAAGFPALKLTEPPPPAASRSPRPEGLARLVHKYDPAARDHRNKTLGLLGEERVFHHERARLIAAERPDLANRVEWTSQERGDGAGYDIKSFDPSGRERLIEVKATRGSPDDALLSQPNRTGGLDGAPGRLAALQGPQPINRAWPLRASASAGGISHLARGELESKLLGSLLKPKQIVLLSKPRDKLGGLDALLPVTGDVSPAQPGVRRADTPVALHHSIDFRQPSCARFR